MIENFQPGGPSSRHRENEIMPSARFFLCPVLVLLSAACSTVDAAGARLDANGDPLPDGAIARLGSNRFRHDQPVFGVAFSPDGKTVATAGTNRQVCLWEAKTGKLLKKFTVVSYAIQSVCFSPRGNQLILGGQDASIRILDAKTGAEQRLLSGNHRGAVTSLSVSADGKSLLSVDQVGHNVVWNLETGAVRRQHTGLSNIRFSGPVLLDDGKSFLTMGMDGGVRVIETSSGKELRKFVSTNGNTFYNGSNQALAVSPDGKRLAVGGWNRPLTVWDLASGKELKRFDPQQTMNLNSLAFSPNGRFLAASQPNQAIVFLGVASGKELRRLKAPGYQPSMAFSPDGKTVVVATGSQLVRLWDVASARDVFPGSSHQGQIMSLHFTPDSKHLVSSGNMGEACLWEVASSRELAVHHFTNFNGQVTQMSADGKRIQVLGHDRALHIWNLPLQGASGESSRQGTSILNPYQATVSPDGKRVMAMGNDRRLMLYDLTGDSKTRSLDVLFNGYFGGAVFSQDSRRVAMSGPDGSVQVWDTATGRRLLATGQNFGPRYYYGGSRMAFSADGRSLLIFDGALRVLELASGRERFSETTQQRQLGYYAPGNFQAAYSPDGRLLARGSYDGTVEVFSLQTGQSLARWQSQQGMIHAIAFSRDGKRLASGGANTTILIWEVPQEPRQAVALDTARQTQLWQELAHDDARRAYLAMRTLAANPDRAVPLFKERLRPPPPVNAQRVALLIADLDNDAYIVREKATRELAAAGAQLEETLRKAVAKAPSVEAKRRLRHLLATIRDIGISPENLRVLRALEVLDGLGTPEARQLLQELSKAPLDHGIAAEVRATLERQPEPPAPPAPKPSE